MKRKTIYDVASEAQVSISTVSRVINGKGYVSEETRKRVEKACENYRPIASAREIQSQKSKTIGIVINHETDYFFLNATFLNILRGIIAVTEKKGYRILLESEKSDDDICNLHYECRVDGLIVIGCKMSSTLISTLEEGKIPFVLIGDYKQSNKISQVEIDDRSSIYDATKYLINLGHKNIGIITGPLEYASGYNRLEGYKEALKNEGISIRDEYIETCDNMTDIKVENLVKKLLYVSEKITALIAFNDDVAISAYKAAQELNIKVGEDISIIGFDNDRIASYINPTLTTIMQPSYEKGEHAANILIEALEKECLPTKREELKGIMIYRDSCIELRRK